MLAALAISLFAACGGSGYGDYDDDEDSQSSEIEARDGGASDARVKDGGAGRSDAGARADGGGAGGSDDDDDDGDDAEDDDDAADAGTGSDAGGGGGADACATLTYQTFGKQFLTNYCVSCHGGSAPNGGVNLTSLANVVSRKAGVKTQVTSGGMPLGNKQPSAAERTRFGQWIDCGPK